MRFALLFALAFGVVWPGCSAEKKQPATEATTMSADQPTSKPAMVFGLGPGFELSPRGNYSAKQEAGKVAITATGENPTPGYEVKLVQSPLRIWPPQWMLARKRPDGIAAQVVTPFSVTESFKSDDPVKAIIVTDATGRHEVPVEQ